MSYNQLRTLPTNSNNIVTPRRIVKSKNGYGYFCKDCGMGITSFSTKSVMVWHFTHDALGCIGHYQQLKRREYLGTVRMQRYGPNEKNKFMFLQDVENIRYDTVRR